MISAYLVADEKALRKGLLLSFAAALVQACVAILIVCTVSVVLRATASTMNRLAMNVELLSFIVVALMGLVITWRKSGKVLGVLALARNPFAPPGGKLRSRAHASARGTDVSPAGGTWRAWRWPPGFGPVPGR